MEFLGLVLYLIVIYLFTFVLTQLKIYCDKERLKASEELRKKTKDDFVNCINCEHLRCRCVNIDNIYYENEYCYICELNGRIANIEKTELLIPKDWCPLINKERKNEK